MPKTTTFDTILWVENPASAGYIEVGEITTLDPPGPEKTEIDVTDLRSTAIEVLMGIPDLGEMSGSGFFNYADPGQAILLADALDPDSPARNFRMDFTQQAMRLSYSAYVKTFKPTVPGPNEAYGFDFALRVDGTITPGAIS